MSLISTYHDLRHLMAMHHIEIGLTSTILNDMKDAYVSAELTQKVPYSVFHRALSLVIDQSVPEDIRKQYFKDSDVRILFMSLDDDFDGLVDWQILQDRLAIAAAMRRNSTVFVNRLVCAKWEGPEVDRVRWICAWRRLAICSSQNSVIQFYSAVGTYQCSFQAHTASVLDVCYLDPIQRLCSVGCDRQIILWDHKKLCPSLKTLVDTPASCVAYDSDNNYIVVALLTGQLMAFSKDLQTAIYRTKGKHDDWVKQMVYIPELRMICTASIDRTVGLWSNEGQLIARKIGHSRAVTCLAYLTTTRLLFSAGQGKEIIAWNPFSPLPAPAHILMGHEKEIVGLFADAINTCLVSVDISMRTVVWDTVRCVMLSAVEGGESTIHHAPVASCCQNPVTRDIVLISDHFCRIASTIAQLRPPKLGGRLVNLHYSASQRLIIASTGTHVNFFNALDGEVLRSIEVFNQAGIHSTALLDDTKLFVMSTDKRVIYYRLTDTGPRELHRLKSCRVLFAFSQPVSYMFNTKGGVVFLLKDGTGSLYSTKESGRSLMLGPISSVSLEALTAERESQINNSKEIVYARRQSVFQSVQFVDDLDDSEVASGCEVSSSRFRLNNADYSPSNDLILIAYNEEICFWSVRKASLFRVEHLMTDTSSPIVSACFIEARNAVAVLHESKIFIYNVGSYVKVLEISEVLSNPGISANRLSESFHSFRSLSRTQSMRVSRRKQMCLTEISHCFGDSIVCLTNIPGNFMVLDLYNAFAKFFATQTGSITRTEKLEGVMMYNTDYAVSLHVPPLTGLVSSIRFGFDNRTREPLVLKIHQKRVVFRSEIAVWEDLCLQSKGEKDDDDDELTTSPYIIQFKTHWESSEGMSPGTASNVIIMERGSISLRAFLNTPERALDVSQKGNSGPRRAILKGFVNPFEATEQNSGESAEEEKEKDVYSFSISKSHPSAEDSQPPPFNKTISQEDQIKLLLFLTNLLRYVHSLDYVVVDFRPRSIVKVGEVWKLCGLDSFVRLGQDCRRGCSPSYTAPELCQFSEYGFGERGANPALDLWALGAMAYEIVTGTKLFDGRSDKQNYSEVTTLLPRDIERIHHKVAFYQHEKRAHQLASLIVQNTLLLNPNDRLSAEDILEKAHLQEFALNVEELASIPVTLAEDQSKALPSDVRLDVKGLTIVGTEQGGSLMSLPRMHLPIRCAGDVKSRLIFLADVDTASDGRVHLTDCHAQYHGSLPRSELGEDIACRWQWPREAFSPQEEIDLEEVQLRGESTVVVIDGNQKSNLEPLEIREEMLPPKGWKGMNESQLETILLDESKLDAEAREMPQDEFVQRFVTQVLHNAPFFKGGNLHGETLPMYAKQPMLRMTKAQYTKLQSEKRTGDHAKRVAKLRADMNKELHLKSALSGTVTTEFLLDDPTDNTTFVRRLSPSKALDNSFDYDQGREFSPTRLAVRRALSPIKKGESCVRQFINAKQLDGQMFVDRKRFQQYDELFAKDEKVQKELIRDLAGARKRRLEKLESKRKK